MSSGPLVGFCFGSTSNASNLVWSIDGCDIFVDCVGSGQLFVDSSLVFENVYEFLELDAFIYNPNVFGQFFYPYVSLGLEQYGIPSSSHFVDDVFVHPCTFDVVFYASSSIMCPTCVTMACTSNCQMTFISNFGDAMLSRSKVKKGKKLDTHVRDLVLKSQFLDFDEKEVDNVNKCGLIVNKHIEL